MENGRNNMMILVIGGVLGALAGLGAGYILTQRAQLQHRPVRLTAGDGVKIGLGVLGLLRLIAEFGED